MTETKSCRDFCVNVTMTKKLKKERNNGSLLKIKKRKETTEVIHTMGHWTGLFPPKLKSTLKLIKEIKPSSTKINEYIKGSGCCFQILNANINQTDLYLSDWRKNNKTNVKQFHTLASTTGEQAQQPYWGLIFIFYWLFPSSLNFCFVKNPRLDVHWHTCWALFKFQCTFANLVLVSLFFC